MLRSKLPPVAREFSEGGAFSLCFERNCDITPALFDRGGSVLAVGRHFVGARARMTHQPQVRGRYRVTIFLRMGGWTEALADKGHKQGERIPQHCYISHNHPYINSSATLGGKYQYLLLLM